MEEWTFRDELRLKPINIARAALHYARDIAYPHLDIPGCMRQLDELAGETRKLIRPSDPMGVQAQQAAAFLFKSYALRGNSIDYFDPRNSYLNEVLQRRLGIPITLSVVFIYIANSLNLPAYGVNLPGHFIVAVRDEAGDLLFDPFHEGQPVTRQACVELVQRTSGYKGPLQEKWFLPVSAEDILARMLNNLRMIYVQEESWSQAMVVIEHLRLVQPDEPEHLRDLGLLYYQAGSMREAAHYLEMYLQQSPEAPDAKTIQQNVWRALDQWVRGN